MPLMPHRTYGIEEVARYLHLAVADVEKLVKNRDIPCERHGDRLVFRKVEIDAWASKRILGLEGRNLTEYHRKTSQDIHPLISGDALMPEMMEARFIDPALPAKTKASVLREMAALAERTGQYATPPACGPASKRGRNSARRASREGWP